MAAPAQRGLWNLDEAVGLRWDAAQLDAVVRNEWPSADRLSTKYQPLSEEFAEPIPPGPYVVYERLPPVVTANMTGATAGDRENQLQQVQMQFRIHAKNTAAETAKSICIRLAKEITDAFDPKNSPWEMNDDKVANILRDPDFGTREGDNEYVWVIQYSVLFDAEYLVA
jgi:hypothetical protein